MKLIAVYARLYAHCLGKALAGIRKSPWTLLLPMALMASMGFAAILVSPLGMVGGIALSVLFDAVVSCYLYFVGEVVSTGRVSVAQFRKSIGAYFWSIMNLLFVFWIAGWVLDGVLRTNPQAALIYGLYHLALFVLLNAVPEVLYEKGTFGGIATLQRTLQFIQENWIEWFIPNLLLGAAAYGVFINVAGFGVVGLVGAAVLGGALLHFVMVFRGHLFEALDGSSHRQRMYRFRAGL